GVHIGDFFDTMAPVGMVVRVDQRGIQDSPLTGRHDELISADPTGRLQVFWSRLEPGATSGPELLQHGSEAEFVLVIQGTIEIILADEQTRLDAGDTVSFSGDIPHGFANSSDTITELVWVSVGFARRPGRRASRGPKGDGRFSTVAITEVHADYL